jgi:hypothetical protein
MRSVAATPSIQVSPHNVVVTFKKVEERLWEVLPGTQSHFAHTLDGDSWCGYTAAFAPTLGLSRAAASRPARAVSARGMKMQVAPSQLEKDIPLTPAIFKQLESRGV